MDKLNPKLNGAVTEETTAARVEEGARLLEEKRRRDALTRCALFLSALLDGMEQVTDASGEKAKAMAILKISLVNNITHTWPNRRALVDDILTLEAMTISDDGTNK